MRAVILENPGARGHCRVSDCPAPSAQPGQALVKVAYAGVNRADLLQRQGRYPVPEGAHPIPGMEISGEVIACAEGVKDFKPGDRVCGLVSEGAFAEQVALDATHLLAVPPGITLEQAAALPEACFTVWISLVWQANLAEGETVLIHGGSSGIGTIAIQVARHRGARVFATAGSAEKCALCETLGAERAVAYKDEDFVAAAKALTQGRGVDVILDMVGGDYFERNLDALAMGGRLAIIAFLKGSKVQANLGPVLLKRLNISGSTLRSRPPHEKTRLAREIKENLWDAVARGSIKPVIDRVFPLEDAEKALLRMDQGLNIGKILLKM